MKQASPIPTNIQNAPEIGLGEFMDRRMRDVSARLNCITLGTIVSFDATNQTASVSINFQRVLRGTVPLDTLGLATDEVQTYDQLQDVPVIFMNGGGAYLTFPISVGDTCILMINDRDMDTWMATGVTGIPNTTRMHDISDAIALVGIRDFQHSLAGYNTKIVSLTDKTGERLSEAGDLKATARSTAPSGWLLCYGQAISRTTYDVLFEAIGTTYGSGDGSSTFNVPDFRGRVPVGLDNMGGSNANVLTNTYNPNRDTLGGAVGEEAHQLTVAELAAHYHNIKECDGTPGGYSYLTADYIRAGYQQTLTTENTGSDVPHQNVQPGRMVNWLIKI